MSMSIIWQKFYELQLVGKIKQTGNLICERAKLADALDLSSGTIVELFLRENYVCISCRPLFSAVINKNVPKADFAIDLSCKLCYNKNNNRVINTVCQAKSVKNLICAVVKLAYAIELGRVTTVEFY